MEYWNDKEAPSEVANQDNGLGGEKGQNQSSQQGPNYNCAIVINGKEIAHVDVSNVDEVQKLVHTLSRKRKTSKDFSTEPKASLSQTQTPEGSRHSSVEYQQMPTQSVQHNIQDNFTDDGTHQMPRETAEFFAKRHQPQTNPYPVFPQNSPQDLSSDQPFFSYRNSNSRLPSAISGNYFQPNSRVESFQYWKQQSQQQHPSAPNPQQQQQFAQSQVDKRRHSMPTLPQRYYSDFPPQQPQQQAPPSKYSTPPYPMQKDPLAKQLDPIQQQQYQNYLLQQQQRLSFEEENYQNFSHLQQQPLYSNYQTLYSNPMFPTSMPNYQSSFGAMQKSAPNGNQGWGPSVYDSRPPSKATPQPTPPLTPTASSGSADFTRTRPLPPDSRRNSTSAIDVRSKNAPPNGKSKDSEQKRRNRINDRLSDLKDLLPEFTDHPEKTATKEEILSETIRYIRLLESECVELTEAITEKQRIRSIASNYGMMGGGEGIPKDMDAYFKRHPAVEDDSS